MCRTNKEPIDLHTCPVIMDIETNPVVSHKRMCANITVSWLVEIINTRLLKTKINTICKCKNSSLQLDTIFIILYRIIWTFAFFLFPCVAFEINHRPSTPTIG